MPGRKRGVQREGRERTRARTHGFNMTEREYGQCSGYLGTHLISVFAGVLSTHRCTLQVLIRSTPLLCSSLCRSRKPFALCVANRANSPSRTTRRLAGSSADRQSLVVAAPEAGNTRLANAHSLFCRADHATSGRILPDTAPSLGELVRGRQGLRVTFHSASGFYD